MLWRFADWRKKAFKSEKISKGGYLETVIFGDPPEGTIRLIAPPTPLRDLPLSHLCQECGSPVVITSDAYVCSHCGLVADARLYSDFALESHEGRSVDMGGRGTKILPADLFKIASPLGRKLASKILRTQIAVEHTLSTNNSQWYRRLCMQYFDYNLSPETIALWEQTMAAILKRNYMTLRLRNFDKFIPYLTLRLCNYFHLPVPGQLAAEIKGCKYSRIAKWDQMTEEVLKSKTIAPRSSESRIHQVNAYIAEIINRLQLPITVTLSSRSAFGSIANPKMAAALVILQKNERHRLLSQSQLKEELCSLFGFSKTQLSTAIYRWRERQTKKSPICSLKHRVITSAVHQPLSVWRTAPAERISIRRLVALPARCLENRHSRKIQIRRRSPQKIAILRKCKSIHFSPTHYHNGIWEFSPPDVTRLSVFGFDTLATGPPSIRIHALEFG
jgi:rubredoxin